MFDPQGWSQLVCGSNLVFFIIYDKKLILKVENHPILYDPREKGKGRDRDICLFGVDDEFMIFVNEEFYFFPT